MSLNPCVAKKKKNLGFFFCSLSSYILPGSLSFNQDAKGLYRSGIFCSFFFLPMGDDFKIIKPKTALLYFHPDSEEG